MAFTTPSRDWWSAEQIAAAALPDLPATRQGVEALARRLDWRAHPDLARPRAGRGGGWEYHWKLFPVRAQTALMQAASAPAPARIPRDRAEVWSWYEGLPEAVKAKARTRLALIQRVMQLAAPMGKQSAVSAVARDGEASERTIWGWLALIESVDSADWLAYLAPRHRAAPATRQRADCAPEFLDWLKADFLRLEAPSFTSCYDRVASLCEMRGLSIMAERTARRWIEANIPRVTLVLAREGERGLARMFPPQIRDRSTLTALEAVNADCHKIDVFVIWPGFETPVRPQIAAFQDLYSNKFLSYRVDLDPNKVAVMAAWGELVETWGIPRHCLFDNGMEFANKWLTGGTRTRFRFKVREDDALGVLPQMGVQVHWARPAHGQAKPIERAFRDWCDRVAKHPAFAGAYVGNRPDAKPENYASRAIPLDDFLAILDAEVARHNARPGRTTDNARGRSFDETFAESYATAPIRKATPEQHRLWLMGQEVRKLTAGHGALKLHENSYWADWMNAHGGESVVARFNPENLHEGLYVYALSGEYLGFAECREKVGFFDLVGAKLHAKAERARKRAEKELLRAMRPVTVDDFAAELAAQPAPVSPLVEAKVVELMPVRHQVPVIECPMPTVDPSVEERLNVYMADFGKPRVAPATVATVVEETAADRFWRALDIEGRAEAGGHVSEEEAEFLSRMQRLPEYRAQRLAYAEFGAAAIG